MVVFVTTFFLGTYIAKYFENHPKYVFAFCQITFGLLSMFLMGKSSLNNDLKNQYKSKGDKNLAAASDSELTFFMILETVTISMSASI